MKAKLALIAASALLIGSLGAAFGQRDGVLSPAVCRGVTTRVAAESAARCLAPGVAFADCEACPKMIVLPSGSFAMGTAAGEEGANADEMPQHKVTLVNAFAIGIYEVTRAEFAAFAAADKDYRPDWCWVKGEGGEWEDRAGAAVEDPGFAQGADHPAVCVSWYDAKAYVSWLARKTGYPYRLLTEAEWEYAARVGTAAPSPFERSGPFCELANGLAGEGPAGDGRDCVDRFRFTSPVGSFPPNAFGLYDMAGNAAEWVEDCYHDTYADAPTNGGPWNFTGCVGGKVLRGGSWNDDAGAMRSAKRAEVVAGDRYALTGLRVARSLFPG